MKTKVTTVAAAAWQLPATLPQQRDGQLCGSGGGGSSLVAAQDWRGRQQDSAKASRWRGSSAAVSSAVAEVAVGKDDKGGGGYGVVGEKKILSIFSFLMFSREAICLDGLFIHTVFLESGFYFNSLICAKNGGAESTLKPSGIFSRSSENKTNRKQNLIIFPRYLILTIVMFVRTTLSSSKL
jgi:hypothetical protein